MANECCNSGCSAEVPSSVIPPRYRRALWIALVVNAGMFLVELAASGSSGSASLVADAADFFGDAANYGITLFVLGLAPIWRTRTAFLKGLMMGILGTFALGRAGWNLLHDTIPEATIMGAVGMLALTANVSVAAVLYTFRSGDANMRSVWLCSRNDAIGNLAVVLAAFGVVGTGRGWPDLVIAAILGVLGLTAARSVIRQVLAELRNHRSVSSGGIPRIPG